MPSKNTITPILGGRYYHVFNRGNNHQQVFFSEENYRYFMQLVDKHLANYISILAYCLIENHFHFLIKINDELSDEGRSGMSSFFKDDIPEEEAIGKIVSNQFRKLFISYTMAVNNREKLKGNLFDRTFKRLEIEDEDYLRYVAFYIHYNPQKHEINSDFRNYRFSSWKAYNSPMPSKLNRQLLIEFFGGHEEFLEYHRYFHDEKENLFLE